MRGTPGAAPSGLGGHRGLGHLCVQCPHGRTGGGYICYVLIAEGLMSICYIDHGLSSV